MSGSRDGFKLLDGHRDGCFAELSDGRTFVVYDGMDSRRDRIGRRGGRTLWHRFRCNDLKCPAVALVRWDVLARFVTDGIRESGEVARELR